MTAPLHENLQTFMITLITNIAVLVVESKR